MWEKIQKLWKIIIGDSDELVEPELVISKRSARRPRPTKAIRFSPTFPLATLPASSSGRYAPMFALLQPENILRITKGYVIVEYDGMLSDDLVAWIHAIKVYFDMEDQAFLNIE